MKTLIDSLGNKLYIQDKTKDIDLVALPLKYVPKDIEIYDIKINSFCDLSKLNMTDQFYIVGYPLGQSAKTFPIWKSGTLSFEHNIKVADDNIDRLSINTIGHSGMSGSPTYFLEQNKNLCFVGMMTNQNDQIYFSTILKHSEFKEFLLSLE